MTRDEWDDQDRRFADEYRSAADAVESRVPLAPLPSGREILRSSRPAAAIPAGQSGRVPQRLALGLTGVLAAAVVATVAVVWAPGVQVSERILNSAASVVGGHGAGKKAPGRTAGARPASAASRSASTGPVTAPGPTSGTVPSGGTSSGGTSSGPAPSGRSGPTDPSGPAPSGSPDPSSTGVVGTATVSVTLYELSGPPMASGCLRQVPVQRSVNAANPARAAVLQLLDGPTAGEAKRGLASVFAHDRSLLGAFRLVDGVATIDFTTLPDLTVLSDQSPLPPSCRAAALRGTVQRTLTGLGVTAIHFQLGGSEAAFKAALTSP